MILILLSTILSANNSFSATCEQTFTVEGDVWNGRVFKGERHINNILKQEAVTQGARIVLADGFIINSTSPELGMISASEIKNDGRTFPLNMMFIESGTGVLGQISISTPAGSSTSADVMKSYMCGLINNIKPTGNSVQKDDATSDKKEDDIRRKLVNVKKLHEDGLITEEEYNEKRKELIKAY